MAKQEKPCTKVNNVSFIKLTTVKNAVDKEPSKIEPEEITQALK